MEPTKIYVDWGKILVILTLLITTSVLGVLDVVNNNFVENVLLMCAVYVFANGRLAAKGVPPSPIIARMPSAGVEPNIVPIQVDGGGEAPEAPYTYP